MNNPCLMTSKELERYLKVSRSTVWRMVRRGELKVACKVGRSPRFDQNDLWVQVAPKEVNT